MSLPDNEHREWRVLLVPDSIYWVTGTICKEIARNNFWIQPTICSTRVLRNILRSDNDIIARIDLVHFVDPWAPRILQDRIVGQVPCVSSIHHVQPKVVETNKATDIIAVGSRQQFDYLRSVVPEDQLALVPYGVNITQFWPVTPERRKHCRRRLGISEEALVVGFFSKKSSDSGNRKGIDILVAGLLMLKKAYNIAALIVGPGWAEMVGRLRAAEVECCWIPYVLDYRKIVDMYHALDVYWVTARVEGGPLTLLEAMSCGICCITTPVGVAPEVVEDKVNAYVVPFDDVEGVVQITEALAADDSLRERIGDAAKATIRETRSWNETMQGINEVYRKASLHFCQRTERRSHGARQPCASPTAHEGTAHEGGNDFPLNAIKPSLHRRTRMLEILYWLNSGDFRGSTSAARQLAWRACRANPWSPEPWAHLLRHAYPAIYRRLSRLIK